MNPLLTRLLPVAAVSAALVGGCAGVLADPGAPVLEGGSALVAVDAGPRLTLSGDGGPAPRFGVVAMRPGTGESRTFVVTRRGPAAPGVLLLSVVDLVEDERGCPEPEQEQDAACGAGDPAELADQLLLRSRSASYDPSSGCGSTGPAVDLRERDLRESAEPVVVRPLLGGPADERVCVTVTLELPDRRDNNVVQGEQVRFGLRFSATAGGPA